MKIESSGLEAIKAEIVVEFLPPVSEGMGRYCFTGVCLSTDAGGVGAEYHLHRIILPSTCHMSFLV